MKYELILFDFDGTLANTLDEITAAMARPFGDNGRTPPAAEAVRQAIGDGLESTIGRLAPDLSSDEILGWCVLFREAYAAQNDARTKLYDGARSLLESAREAGIRLAVLSNKDEASVHRGLLALGISEFFEIALGTVPGLPKKPDAQVFELRIEGAFPKIEKQHILMVGDDIPDLAFARNFGGDACWARYGFGDPKDCAALEPRWTVDNLPELQDIVLA